jgi:DNA-binding CsgD family transcriptional regulator
MTGVLPDQEHRTLLGSGQRPGNQVHAEILEAPSSGPDETEFVLLEMTAHLEPEETSILYLTVQGLTPPEIAQKLDISTRTVYRVREKLREILEARLKQRD